MLFAKLGSIVVKFLLNMSTEFGHVISLSSTIKGLGYMGGCLIFLFMIQFNTFQVFFAFF